MIDNFDIIGNNLQFINDKSFYHIMVMKRKKDNPDMKGDSKVIDNYYVFSKDQFQGIKQHVIDKCEANKARAYIKINCLDAETVMLKNIKILSEELMKENWKGFLSALTSACGSCNNQKGTSKLYLLDLDNISVGSAKMEEIADFVNSLKPEGDKVKIVIPTRNGCHLIVTGFDILSFSRAYPEIQCQPDANTLLYFPNSIN